MNYKAKPFEVGTRADYNRTATAPCRSIRSFLHLQGRNSYTSPLCDSLYYLLKIIGTFRLENGPQRSSAPSRSLKSQLGTSNWILYTRYSIFRTFVLFMLFAILMGLCVFAPAYSPIVGGWPVRASQLELSLSYWH